MAGTTDVHRDIRGIRAIGVRDTEVILYMSLFILLFSKYYTDIKISEEIITIICINSTVILKRCRLLFFFAQGL